MSTSPLQGRVAVITGATAGIGEATARELVGGGCFCVLNARRERVLRDLAKELGEEDVMAVAGDCCQQKTIDSLLDAARDSMGNPGREADIVVVNAGRGLAGSVTTSDVAQWEEMVRTNVLGAALLIRAAANRMLAEMERAGDSLKVARDIVVLGSTVGRHISPFSSMYGGTKFAVNSMAEAARRELGPKGIRVTLIEPAFVESEFQQVAGYKQEWFNDVKARIGPVLKPEDVARSIAFVLSQPPAVHLSDVLIRPTRQDYP
ncbi:MAG: SDR family oxidoreductase [Phycisphaerales bacterium]